jgi:tetratricopeptide (TPR) repeat protein
MPSPSPRFKENLARLAPLLIAAAAFLAFWPALHNGFVNWDDDANILNNFRYRGLDVPRLKWMFTTFHMGLYQPLSWLSLALDHALWGMNPMGYHLTSLILHALNAALFYLLGKRLLGLAIKEADQTALPLAAALAALLFALHPLRVESVAWATERRDVLSGFFFLGALLCYIEGRKIPSLALFAASLLSKGIGVTFPLVLVIIDVYPLRRLTADPKLWPNLEFRTIWMEKIPFFLLALAVGLIGIIGQAKGATILSLETHGPAARAAQALFGTAFYLCKTAVPTGLSPLYPLPLDLNPLAWPFLLSGAFVLTLSLGFFFLRRRRPWGLAAWAYYLATLFPVLGLVQFGPQIAADRYTYLSCLGWALLAGGGFLYAWRSRNLRAPVLAAAVLIVASLGTLTWKQSKVWHDSEILWRHALAVDPNLAIAHNNLGEALAGRGKLPEAMEQYRETIRLNIRDSRFSLKVDPSQAKAHNNLGVALAMQGQLQEAMLEYDQALRIDPRQADAYSNIGIALKQQGKVEEAMEQYRRALSIAPDHVRARNNLGNALALQGRLPEAIAEYRRVLEIDPGYAKARNSLEKLLGATGPARP